MSTDKKVLADDRGGVWIYEVPIQYSDKYHLLTIGNTAVHGPWRGKLGEFYKAYLPMPKRNKQLEEELGL